MHTLTLKLAHDFNIGDFTDGAAGCCCFMKHNGVCMRPKTMLAQKILQEYKKKYSHHFIIHCQDGTNMEIGQVGTYG
jgi:hypothetical protein